MDVIPNLILTMFSKKIKISYWILLWIVLGTITGCQSSDQSNSVIVFTDGTLIIGDGSAPVTNSVVIVENDKVIEVGRKGEIDDWQNYFGPAR